MNISKIENVSKKEKNPTKIRVSLETLNRLNGIKGLIRAYSSELTAFVSGAFLNFGVICGVNPFGIASICSCNVGKKGARERLCALLGVALTSGFIHNGLYIFLSAFVAASVLFFFERFEINREGRIILTSLCASLVLLPLGVVGFLGGLLGIPVFSLAFCGLLQRDKKIHAFWADSGFLSLALGVVSSLLGIELGFLSFPLVAATFFALEGGERGKYFLGGLAGFFGSIVLGVEYLPAFVIGGFVCGGIIKKVRYVGVFSMFAVSALSFFLFLNGNNLITALFSTFWGCCLWVSVSHLFLDKRRAVAPVTRKEYVQKEQKRLSEAIGGISLALSSVSKAKRREREERIQTVIEGIFSFECEACPGCSFSSEPTKRKLCECVMKNKKVTEKDFSETFSEGCSRRKIIEEKVNGFIEENPYKTSLRIDTLAEDYMAMSRLLACGERRAERKYYHDIQTSKKIVMALELKNVRVTKVDVFGTRLPMVEIIGVPFKVPFPEKIVLEEVERIVQKKMTITCIETEGKTVRIELKAICDLSVEYYKISVPKKGEILCGDSVSVFEGEDGYFYSIISDGMGSGRDAAVCSKLGTVFLEKLISAGVEKTGALSMLGGVVSSAEDEIFTTVDLMEIDLVRGRLALLKAGAAPTWILRNGNVYTISSKTLPCGIIPRSSAEQTVIDCCSGDVIIMASDGGEWALDALDSLGKMLKEKKSSELASPKEVAVYLADEAIKKGGRADDVSFCVTRVL